MGAGAVTDITERALTVRPPWSWAIIHGGKLVENRSQGAVGWRYRGRLWIHAAKGWSGRGATDPRVVEAVLRQHPPGSLQPEWHPGHVIGSVELVDVHPASGCCEPWGEETYPPANPEARPPGRVTHLILENPVPLEVPIPARGRLGLWPFDPHRL